MDKSQTRDYKGSEPPKQQEVKTYWYQGPEPGCEFPTVWQNNYKSNWEEVKERVERENELFLAQFKQKESGAPQAIVEQPHSLQKPQSDIEALANEKEGETAEIIEKSSLNSNKQTENFPNAHCNPVNQQPTSPYAENNYSEDPNFSGPEAETTFFHQQSLVDLGPQPNAKFVNQFHFDRRAHPLRLKRRQHRRGNPFYRNPQNFNSPRPDLSYPRARIWQMPPNFARRGQMFHTYPPQRFRGYRNPYL